MRPFLYSILVFLPVLLQAQYEHHLALESQRISDGDVQATFTTGVSKFVTARNRFLESTAGVRYAAGPWEFSTTIRLNNQINFDIPADGSFLNLSEHETVFIDPNFSLENESYQISKPFSFTVTRQFGFVRTSFDLSPVIRSERLWTPLIDRIDSTTYTISSYEDKREQADFIGGILAETGFGPISITGGINSISFGRVGDPRIPAASMRPVIGAGFCQKNSRTDILWNLSDVYLQHIQSLNIPLISEHEPAILRVRGSMDRRNYDSFSGSVSAVFPVTDRLEFTAGYTSVRSASGKFTKDDLKRWYGSIAPPWDDDLESRLPHSSVKAGIQYDLRKERAASDILLVGCSIQQRDLYFSKRDFYAFNPIGTISVRNTAAETAEGQFVLEIEGGLGVYRTGVIRLHAGESREIPMFLYLADMSVVKTSETREMNLTMTESGKEWGLATVQVSIHEAHHWDGDTRNLHFFLTPEEPSVIEHARRVVIASADRDTNHTEYQRMFSTLKGFINAIGKDLHYVSDPTTTYVVDRVQYPVETLDALAGDCEDLVVYTASYLMAIGYRCAVVDLPPQGKTTGGTSAGIPGHVFLLVDTGIESERAMELDLVDVQWVSRRSYGGAATIWIPIETTVLNKGFEEAFRSGMIQYYENVIAPPTFSRRSVNIVDF